MSFVFEQEFSAPPAALRFMQSNQVSSEAILRLYSQHSVTSVRTAEDIRKFLQIPKTAVHTAWNQSNQLVAYAIEGKGADLTGYVHEWGGSAPHLLALFSHIRKEKKAPFTVITPSHSHNLNQQLGQIPGVVTNQGFLGMIKIIHQENFFQKVKRGARAMGLKDFVLEKRGEEILLGLGGDLIALNDEKDIVRLLFGPSVEIPYLKNETQDKLAQFLPLPLWVWGWDSI